MVVLDIAIVNVALPSIQQDLGIEQSTLQWILIAYGLMLGGFLLLGGRMADLLGRRRMLLTGLTLFSSASLLAGVAGSAGLLIGTRALQGFGAALLSIVAISTSVRLDVGSYDLNRRDRRVMAARRRRNDDPLRGPVTGQPVYRIATRRSSARLKIAYGCP